MKATTIIKAMLLLLTVGTMQAQNYGYKWSEPDPDLFYYVNMSFDVNNAFEIKDNPRMKTQVNGFDYDIEAGIKYGVFAPHIFYGQFKKANIFNYGVGLDVYPELFLFINTGIGAGWSRVDQKTEGGIGGFYARGIISINLTNNIAFTTRLQAQRRADVAKDYIIEAAAGFTFLIHGKR